MLESVPSAGVDCCARCSVYKVYTFTDAAYGQATMELHHCDQTFHANVHGLWRSMRVFEVCCELRNGQNTEWLKECIDAFVKQFDNEGFKLQKPEIRAQAPKMQALTRKADLTNAEISSFFHMPIKDASRELGLSTTYLKRICRQLGIPRWPYRKVASLAFDAH